MSTTQKIESVFAICVSASCLLMTAFLLLKNHRISISDLCDKKQNDFTISDNTGMEITVSGSGSMEEKHFYQPITFQEILIGGYTRLEGVVISNHKRGDTSIIEVVGKQAGVDYRAKIYLNRIEKRATENTKP